MSSAPSSPRPRGLTGLFARIAAVMVALFGALVAGVLRALVGGFARALGGAPTAPPPGSDAPSAAVEPADDGAARRGGAARD